MILKEEFQIMILRLLSILLLVGCATQNVGLIGKYHKEYGKPQEVVLLRDGRIAFKVDEFHATEHRCGYKDSSQLAETKIITGAREQVAAALEYLSGRVSVHVELHEDASRGWHVQDYTPVEWDHLKYQKTTLQDFPIPIRGLDNEPIRDIEELRPAFSFYVDPKKFYWSTSTYFAFFLYPVSIMFDVAVFPLALWSQMAASPGNTFYGCQKKFR